MSDRLPDDPNWLQDNDLTNEQRWIEFVKHTASILGLDKVSLPDGTHNFNVKCVDCDRNINKCSENDLKEILKWATKHAPKE